MWIRNKPISLVRGFLRWMRVGTAGSARFGFRAWRTVDYAFSLVIWSRVMRNRLRRRVRVVDETVLESRGIAHHAPMLKVEGGALGRIFENGFNGIYPVLAANLNPPGLLSSFRHAQPGPAFRGVYLWDSAFIAQIWKYWDPAVASDIVRSVVELREDGRLQHVVADFVKSLYTQPPLIAWSARELSQTLPEGSRASFLHSIYEPLVEFNRWLYAHRRVDYGLFAWAHPYESGVENAPRFSDRSESHLAPTRRRAAPDFCAYMVLQNEALAWMAKELNRPADEVRFADQAAALRAATNRLLWSDEDGLYYDRDASTGQFVRSSTIASLLPLWAGIPSAGRAERMVGEIVRRESFNTMIPLPSVARCDADFSKDMWRGPVWINTAYGVIQGLRRYQYDELAADLSFRLCRGVYQVFADERFFYEFYDPEAPSTKALTRKKGNWWKGLTLGTGPQRDFVGWTGLVNNLLLENVLGLRPEEGEVNFHPRLPKTAEGLTWRLTWPLANVCVELKRGDGPIGAAQNAHAHETTGRDQAKVFSGARRRGSRAQGSSHRPQHWSGS